MNAIPDLEYFMAVNRRRIPERLACLNNLQLFRAGFDSADIALFRHQSEASVSSSIHWLRERERKMFSKAS